MATTTIPQLVALDNVSTNLSSTLFVVYDSESGTTRKASLSQIDTAIERTIQNVSSAAVYANAAFNVANSVNIKTDAAFSFANTVNVKVDAAFAQANAANILAQAAFNQANTGGGLTANSVATLNNKTFDVSVGSNNIFSIQGQSITAYSGSGQVVLLQQSPTISVLNLNDSQLNLDGGTGIYYWSGQSDVAQAGDLKAGVYSSDPTSHNSLFTFGGAGANNMSVSVEGSLFIGTAKPSNDGGLNTTYPGWLVVQSGAKFGGDIDTLGGVSANTITANNLTVSNTFTVSGVVLQWHTPIPLTSKGDPGDKAGYIAIDNDKIYRCVADYTDGTADIWKYINFTGGTWG